MQRRATTISLKHLRHMPLTLNERAGRMFLFVAFTVYVLSGALLLHDIIPDGLKHVVFIFGAAWSLARNPTRSLCAVVVTLPLALIYFVGEMPMYGAMVITLSLSLPLFWFGIASVMERRDYRFIFTLLLIALIPAMLSLPIMMVEGPFSMTYGRPRLLMGYFHPKEAAAAFAIPMLMAMRINRKPHLLIWAIAFVFLWEVGSRNTALSIALIWSLRWHTRATLAGMLALAPAISVWVLVTPDWYDKLNTLFSLRLTIWDDIIRNGRPLAIGSQGLEERFGADNFFVEAYVLAGPLSILLISASIVLVTRVFRLEVRGSESIWPALALFVLLFYASFDSGIASTGNLMHAFFWSTALSPIFRHVLSRRQVAMRAAQT